ncbi:host specificity factor TipJ family phage tail protein [Methylorubrum populi]
MTLIVTANIAGQTRGEPVRLPDRRRRRLSTIVARHRPPAGRRFIVSVHRRGETFLRPTDAAVRLRASWRNTLMEPGDTVLFTVVPLGGKGLSIGLTIASLALIVLAPYAAPAIAAGIGLGASTAAVAAVQAGLVIGGAALGYAAQASAAAKKKTERSLSSVTGGGNVPKPGARKPLLYGRCWSTPPLSQKDFFAYDGDTMVLTKRMTLGIGRFQIHAVHVGEAVFWTEAGGIQAPFTSTVGPLGTAIEFLYGQPSTLAPGDVMASPSVGGQELPRLGGNPEWTPWFRLTPQGVTADAAQMSWTYPAIYRVSSQGRQVATVAGVVFQGQELDPTTGQPIGPVFELWRSSEGATALTTQPLRRSAYFRLPKNGTYQVRAQNMIPEAVGFEQKNAASWDEMAAIKDDVRVRPATTEIVMRVRAGKGLTVTAFSEIWVDATRILPVYDKATQTWTERATRKAVWAFADLVRAEHGLAQASGFDADKAADYAGLLDANDTFDGALPEVSSFWEAASEVLLPLRADPVKVGPVHSFVRDESRAEPRHILSRRQIVRDSGRATYKTKVEGGDVIVEFDRDGDPRRPDEVRFHYGPPTRTPKRYKVNGISEGLHALKHATWLAAVAVFRGAERQSTTEWDGRLVFPGDHILSDLWFLKSKRSFGVASAAGHVLTLDVNADVPAEWGYGTIRSREGREWGILRMRGAGRRGLELHPDDVAALTGRTGLALTDVLARETQDPTTVVIGDLVELQETYVARSAIPSDAGHVQIEMVADDPRVWQLLDEQVIAPAPVNADSLAEPLIPDRPSVLHARCERIETGIEVVWGVSSTRGARAYEADLSYDAGKTWEPLSPFGPASSGRAPMRQADGPVTVRARAFGRTGLPGDYIATTFTTVAPLVQGALVDIATLAPIPYDKLGSDAKAKIEAIEAAADAAGHVAQAAATDARARVDALRRALAVDPKQRAGFVDPLIGDVRQQLATLTDVALRLQAEIALLKDRQAAAGIEVLSDEGRVRIAAVARLESSQTALSVTVDALRGEIALYGSVQTGDLSGLVGSITTVQQRLNAVDATITTLATSGQIDGFTSRLASAEQTIGAQAAVIAQKAALATVDAQGTRLSTAEQRISAAEGRISNVVTAAGTGTVDTALLPGLLSRFADVLGRQIGAIQDNIARAETNTSANFDGAGRAVAEVSTRLLSFQGEAAAQFASVTRAMAGTNEALVQSQTLLSAQIGKVAADLTTEASARVTADAAATVRLDGALSRLGDVEAGLTSEQQTRANADSAFASSLSSLTARTANAEATLTSLGKTVADNQSATASQFDGITARVGGVEAGLATEVKARADAVSAQADRTDRLVAQTNSDRAYFLASEKARIDTEGALSQQISGLGTRVGSSETAISDLRTAQSNQTSAQASTNIELYARTDAGTAYGQFAMGAVSAPDGVSARIACFAGTDRNGTKHNGGWFIDVLPNNTARFVIDATLFAITANGGMTYPFTFDGTTLTIPKLKVTQEAILPGATTDPFSFVTPGDVDAGASSDEWREIPGTGYSLTPDGPGWSIFFSGVARAQVTAVGTAYLYLSSSIQIAIGVDGVPYGGGGFFTLSAGSGAGAAPIPNTNTSGLTYSNAGLEILAAYQPRRFSLLYKFKADPGSSGKILYGQLKVVVIKR